MENSRQDKCKFAKENLLLKRENSLLKNENKHLKNILNEIFMNTKIIQLIK